MAKTNHADQTTSILIIEGPDCAGKSTLIEQMRNMTEFQSPTVIKQTYKPSSKHDVPQLFKRYDSIVSWLEQPSDIPYTILDRFYPSEICYSSKRGYDWREWKTYFQSIEQRLSTLGASLVVCLPPIEELEQRYLKRGDDHVSIDELWTLRQNYIDFCEWTTLPRVPLYDTTPDIKQTLFW